MNISRKVYLVCIASFLGCVIAGVWFLHSEIFTAVAQSVPAVTFTVEKGESAAALAGRLSDEHVIRHAGLFKKYVAWKGVDSAIQAGDYTVTAPITLARVVAALSNPAAQNERTITIIPGWNIRDVGGYFEREGLVVSSGEWNHAIAGYPARMDTSDDRGCREWQNLFLRDNIPVCVSSLEGYLAPDTYRVYKNAAVDDIIDRLVSERERQFTPAMLQEIKAQGKTVHEILTMASILEQEVRSKSDKAKVSDLFWRRLGVGMALQADSTVHYVVGKAGSVFTTAKDRETDSPWNTYKYPGLPPGPICNPGLDSIMAAIYPEKNDAWYFLTTMDGEVKYGRTLEEHNGNRMKYL